MPEHEYAVHALESRDEMGSWLTTHERAEASVDSTANIYMKSPMYDVQDLFHGPFSIAKRVKPMSSEILVSWLSTETSSTVQ
jgi:hypothetical protein